MTDLAFDMNGQRFEVPANATGWRVRRMKVGAPENLLGRGGLPLVLPIEATLDDLRLAVGRPGRYRLDLVAGEKALGKAPVGFAFLREGGVLSTPPSQEMLADALRLNAEVMRASIDRLPQILEAAALLLRATELRAQRRLADEDMVRKLEAAHDCDEASDDGLVIEPGHRAHFQAIQARLSSEEAVAARELAESFSPEELRAWLDELMKLNIPQALQAVRVLIAGNTEAVS